MGDGYILSDESQKKLVVIGISGPSSSGKTTLAHSLASVLPSAMVIHQDEFYKSDGEIPIDNATGYLNWDTPEALNREKMLAVLHLSCKSLIAGQGNCQNCELSSMVKNGSVELYRKEIENSTLYQQSIGRKFIILDGFMLFDNEDIIKELNVALFLEVGFDRVKRRRERRYGYPMENGFWIDPPQYVEKIVWPEYLSYRRKVLENARRRKLPNFLTLSSEAKTPLELLQDSIVHILSTLQKEPLSRDCAA